MDGMYFDNDACHVCGSKVELKPHGSEPRSGTNPDGTADERICTNPDCETNSGRTTADGPNP